MNIDISIHDDAWDSQLIHTLVHRSIPVACGYFEDMSGSELSVVLTNDEEIQELNKNFRNKDKPTNVLSFPGEEDILGDIILSRETLEREALEQKKSFENHVTHMIIHGFLHLLGYDHMNDEEAHEMEGLEIEILEKLNIENPYENDN